MATGTAYGLGNGGIVINPITHKLSLYNNIEYNFI